LLLFLDDFFNVHGHKEKQQTTIHIDGSIKTFPFMDLNVFAKYRKKEKTVRKLCLSKKFSKREVKVAVNKLI
jgi:hypothetical protein